MQQRDILLKIKSLSAGFGPVQVLSDITMEAEKNKVIAVIGPSGCGKSTFIRCLNRLHEETPNARVAGEVLLENKNIYSKEADPVLIRRNIGMVFQKPNPFPGMSVYNNVAVGPRLSGVRRRSALDERAENCLRSAGLWAEVKDRLKKSASGLSGGQQQRLCIARALAVNPSIILMDEPTSALDPVSTIWIEELIQKLKERVTVILVTHNMQQASRVSDWTSFLLQGRLVEYNKTSRFFTNPSDKRSEDYITGRF